MSAKASATRLWRTAAFLCCFAVAAATAFADEQEVPVGGVLRDAALRGLNGPSQNLAAYRGKPLIINFWASWCGPCREEMASLERLAWRNQYFVIIGISTDDYAEQAAGLLKKSNATISQFIDTRLQMEKMLGASRLPLTVLVDADGRVLDKVYGARQWDGADAQRLIDATFHNKLRAQ
jgi:thiol-disulfide isomerase/thioredoxin